MVKKDTAVRSKGSVLLVNTLNKYRILNNGIIPKKKASTPLDFLIF